MKPGIIYCNDREVSKPLAPVGRGCGLQGPPKGTGGRWAHACAFTIMCDFPFWKCCFSVCLFTVDANK